jgi:hypothetical protein
MASSLKLYQLFEGKETKTEPSRKYGSNRRKLIPYFRNLEEVHRYLRITESKLGTHGCRTTFTLMELLFVFLALCASLFRSLWGAICYNKKSTVKCMRSFLPVRELLLGTALLHWDTPANFLKQPNLYKLPSNNLGTYLNVVMNSSRAWWAVFRIRDPVPFWTPHPGSEMGKNPGWTSGIIFPRA